jgi:hypothetical protein
MELIIEKENLAVLRAAFAAQASCDVRQYLNGISFLPIPSDVERSGETYKGQPAVYLVATDGTALIESPLPVESDVPLHEWHGKIWGPNDCKRVTIPAKANRVILTDNSCQMYDSKGTLFKSIPGHFINGRHPNVLQVSARLDSVQHGECVMAFDPRILERVTKPLLQGRKGGVKMEGVGDLKLRVFMITWPALELPVIITLAEVRQ